MNKLINDSTKVKVKKSEDYSNAKRYRGLAYNRNINKNVKPTVKYYENKIGLSLKGEVTDILSMRKKTILIIANAGGGKTYVTLQVASELVELNEEKNVAYILAVPTTSQSNQNEVSEDLVQFGFSSEVGNDSKLEDKKEEEDSLANRIKGGARKFSCVFDKVGELVEELNKQNIEVVLVVDEAHKLIWDTYRVKALKDVDDSLNRVALTVMLTATPRTCLKYYEYDEIFEFKDKNVKNNIVKFSVRFTDNWEETLRKNIKKIVEAGKTALIRLNNKKLITSLRTSLMNQGYVVEVMSSENKDDYTFKTIEKDGTIGDDVDIVFCTSVIECGISLKDTRIVPVEIIRSYKDFNSDNTIQFFARPRKEVSGGLMIIKNYQENLAEVIKSLKEKRSKAKDKEIKATVRALCNVDTYFRRVDLEVAQDFEYLNNSLTKALLDGIVYAREFMVNELKYRDRNKVIVFDEEKLKLYIDEKKIIQKAFKLMDEDIIIKSPLLLETYFKESIFYGEVDVDIDDNEELSEEDKLSMAEAKEVRKQIVEAKKAQEDIYKEWLKDEKFLKLIPALIAGGLNRANIKNYDVEMSLKDIIGFKNSALYELLVECLDYFSLEEACEIITSKYDNSGKYLEKTTVKDICEQKHTIEQIKQGYLKTKIGSTSNAEYKFDTICEVIEHYKDGDSQILFTDEIVTVVHYELVRKKGIKNYKHKNSLDLLYEIDPYLYNVEMDWKKFYTSSKIEKLESVISSTNKKTGKTKITKSIKSKIIKEVNKIYKLGIKRKGDLEYPVINSPRKVFDLDSVLSEIKASK